MRVWSRDAANELQVNPFGGRREGGGCYQEGVVGQSCGVVGTEPAAGANEVPNWCV